MRILISVFFLFLNCSFISYGQNNDSIIEIVESLFPKEQFYNLMDEFKGDYLEENSFDNSKQGLDIILFDEIKKTDYYFFVENISKICTKLLTDKELQSVQIKGQDELINLLSNKYSKEYNGEFDLFLRNWMETVAKKIIPEVSDTDKDRFLQNSDFDCSIFHTGEFTYVTFNSIQVDLVRTKEKQIEKVDSFVYEYKIEWLGNCRYTISDISETKSVIDSSRIEVNIYEIKGDTCFYVAKNIEQLYSLGFIEVKK